MVNPLHYGAYPYWHYRASVAQVVGVPADMGIEINVREGDLLIIDNVYILAGTFGAGRDILFVHLDEDDNQIKILLRDNITTGQKIMSGIQVISNSGTVTEDAVGFPFLPYVIPSSHKIILAAQSLANTEVITLDVLARIVSGIRYTQAAGDIAPRGAGVANPTVVKNEMC